MKKLIFLITLLVPAVASPAYVAESQILQVDLLTTMLYAPHILAMDSKDKDTRDICKAINVLAHAIKASNLYKDSQGSLDMMKAGVHVAAVIDTINDRGCTKSNKMTHLLNLGIETVLRGGALYFHQQGEMDHVRKMKELGDIVGLFRALNMMKSRKDYLSMVHQNDAGFYDEDAQPDAVNNEGDRDESIKNVREAIPTREVRQDSKSMVQAQVVDGDGATKIHVPESVKETVEKILTPIALDLTPTPVVPIASPVYNPMQYMNKYTMMRGR